MDHHFLQRSSCQENSESYTNKPNKPRRDKPYQPFSFHDSPQLQPKPRGRCSLSLLGKHVLIARHRMSRGELIIRWSEPAAWRQAALALAKKEGRSTFPWVSWILALGLLAGVITWDWSHADPTKRVGVPSLIGIMLALFGFFFAVAWTYVRLNRTTRTSLHERGLLHGSFSRRRWIPWPEIEFFSVDEEAMGPQRFRFLTWTRVGAEEEEFSVLADDVDSDVIVRVFQKNKVAEVGAGRSVTRFESDSVVGDKPPPEAEKRSR